MDAAKRLAAGVVLALVVPSTGSAQAWTPPKGEGLLTLTFQSLNAGHHLFSVPPPGQRSTSVDVGEVEGRILVLDGDLGITEKLGLSLSLAYVEARFPGGGHIDESEAGDHPHSGLPIDDGDWHGSFQDARLALRYMQTAGWWVITPSVAAVFPVRSYPTLGHASIGRGLNELQLGLDAGRILLLSGRPRAYFQGSYRYAFIEEVQQISMNRSDLLLELGYLVHPRLTVRGLGALQHTHGGLDWLGFDLHSDEFHDHDRVAASEYVRLGVGVSIPIGPDVNLSATVAQTVEGENTHDATTVSVGMSWGLQAPGFGKTKIRFPGGR